MTEKRRASESKVQKEVEQHVLAELSSEMAIALVSSKIPTGHSYIEIDGLWKDPSLRKAVVVEVFAHAGRVKAAQRHKVQTDVFKLFLAQRILREQGYPDVTAIVVFVCPDCAKPLTGKTWVGDAAKAFGISTTTRKLPPDLHARLLAAQAGQNLMTAHAAD